MPSKYGNDGFYHSPAWRKVSAAYLASKNYVCERCGKPATICHHKKWLNAHNVNNPSISLSFDNLEALCLDCHNAEHGLKHDIAIFNEAGEVIDVKQSMETKRNQRDCSEIDRVLARARSVSSVVSSEREV